MKVKSENEVAQSCPSLSDPVDCSPPDSLVHGIFQARVLEWVAIAFSHSIVKSQHVMFMIEKLIKSNTAHLVKVWRFLKLKIELPYDPAVSLLGIYLEKKT